MMYEDKFIFWSAICFVAFVILYFVCWISVNNAVDNARTREELKFACKGLSIENAPVRCLELAK